MTERPESPPAPAGREQSLPRRLAFRFAFCFFVLLYLPLPFGMLARTDWIADEYQMLVYGITPWVGEHLLGLAEPVQPAITGSGDTSHNWVLLLCQATLAVALASVWSLLDRRRTVHPWWEEGLRIYLRYGLGFFMLLYGLVKVFPGGQFGPVGHEQMLSPLGRFSPMALLWAFMGASQGYTQFAGLGETLGGMLLLFRRTALLGALLSAAILTNVLALNLFYDVPVKLFSAQLLLTALFLILPDARRLAGVLILNRPTAARDLAPPPLPLRSLSPRAARSLAAAALVAKFGLIAAFFFDFRHDNAFLFSAPRPVSPLFGFYEVDSFAVDGRELPPALTEPKRWRRVLFGRHRGFSLQTMDDQLQRWTVKTADEKTGKLELVGRRVEDKRSLSLRREDGGILVLEGKMGEETIVVRLRRVEEPKYELTSRGFHWVSEYPYQRF